MIDENKLIEDIIPILNKHNNMYLTGKLICCIDTQQKIENTEDFKHFKLFSDSTLKSMTKDELIEYIHVIYHNWKVCDYFYNNAIDYAKKESENIPLKFEQLHEGMWVWDNKSKSYIFIFKQLNWKPVKGIRFANQIIYHSAMDIIWILKKTVSLEMR